MGKCRFVCRGFLPYRVEGYFVIYDHIWAPDYFQDPPWGIKLDLKFVQAWGTRPGLRGSLGGLSWERTNQLNFLERIKWPWIETGTTRERRLNLSEVSRFYVNPFTFVGYRNNHSILIFRRLGNNANAHISRLGYLWWNTTRTATAIGFIIKSTTLLVQYTFLCISSPLLHDYDMKFPQLTSYGGRKHARTNFSFSL